MSSVSCGTDVADLEAPFGRQNMSSSGTRGCTNAGSNTKANQMGSEINTVPVCKIVVLRCRKHNDSFVCLQLHNRLIP